MNFWNIGRIVLCILQLTSAVTDIDFMVDVGDEYINVHAAETSSPVADINIANTSAVNEEASVKTPVIPKSFVMRSSYVLDAVRDSVVSVPSHNDAELAFTAGVSNSAKKYNDAQTLWSRPKRTLTYPDPATILLIFGLGTPLQLDRESVIIGAFTKMLYTLPTNSTDFTEAGPYLARTKSRWSIYKVLEKAAEIYGFSAGKGCLLRAICEVATAPFDRHHGLFGQMAQAFLTPSSTSEAYDEYGDREYHAAERLGRDVTENCHVLYPECERSVLDIFSNTAITAAAAGG